MKPREYCCCAIPVVYTGIYFAILEQFAAGIITATLAVATPQIVGAAVPSFAKWIFAIICYVGAALQFVGLFAVRGERPSLFRIYVTLHTLITLAAFAVAAVWIIISATRHTTAETNCRTTYYSGTNTTILTDEANTLCDIFPWVDIGLMAGLWALMAIMQLYLFFVLSSYATGIRRDHAKYDSLYDPTAPLASDIPLRTRGDPWDAHGSPDSFANPRGYHDRSESVASVSTVIGDRMQQNRDYNDYDQTPYDPIQPENDHAEMRQPYHD
ncbi:uncharacterized protein LAESUDRAFT_654583 [Laetiporus sulphureus 93-53]|uniref:Uncharacterized protein n=1 Tax=Laetiporus sulphureus 93-53 TaxID=1314785 RepID=A0A165DZG1_9APHY|nr:uncharacterized protein LAESUDRAFT_654583 [Laetiporus sulphureus 93-53]KZT05953.1 hypothetical protein LAESUDRAFT_654583 [Laetiporus sulphureus 93-53]